MVPKVMIILGSASDKEIANKSIKILEKLQIPYSLKVASAHRTHDKVKMLVKEATKQGVEVFIGIAGLAAHLPGAIAAYTHRPVIGVPVNGALDGLDSLYASAEMPFPAPVATVGIGRGDNGAILAGQIIGVNNPQIKENISKLREEYQQKVEKGEKEVCEDIEGEYFEKDFLSEFTYEKKDFKGTKNNPDALIIAGSYTDIKVAKEAEFVLKHLKITNKIKVISPIRRAEEFEKIMSTMSETKVFIAISGLSALVAGSIVALTEKPVIGVPCSNELGGNDALLSMTNMPPGVPVGTLGIDNGKNAGILAGEILGISNEEIENNVKWNKYKDEEF